VDLGPAEIRVLGYLVEKQRTTPDAYPLTLNALRLACNQSTNREPVVDYHDAAIRAALERLARRRLARVASGPGSRAPNYRHLLSDTLGLADDELAARRAHAARAADPRRAQGALRAPLPVRRPRVGRGRARAARRPGDTSAGSSAVPAGRRSDSSRCSVAPEAGDAGREPRARSAADQGAAPDGARSLEERLAALEREVADLRAELRRLGGGAAP
jgi:uncharacterized protein YceH (UPF0502 family)